MKVLFWGTGNDCKLALEKYPEILEHICVFIDSNAEKQKFLFFGKKVVAPERIFECEFDFIVIGTTKYMLEICMYLMRETSVEKSRIIDIGEFIGQVYKGREKPQIFYLKINKNRKYVFRNIQHWVDIIHEAPRPQCFIVCDSKELQESVVNQIDFYDIPIQFIHSSRAKELNYIVTNTCTESWWNAGYAHLTTFYHARENHYNCFWNIDADDTCICLSAVRAYELLEKVKDYAKKFNIRLFSLDMWRTVAKSVTGCEHWTFGITYTDNTVDWLEIMRMHATDPGVQELRLIKNIDCYVTYLNMIIHEKIETWYFENLKFIHYSDDFFEKPQASGFFHWKEGRLMLPILYYCFGAKSRGSLKIAEDVLKLDMNIKDEESTLFLLEYAEEKINVVVDK